MQYKVRFFLLIWNARDRDGRGGRGSTSWRTMGTTAGWHCISSETGEENSEWKKLWGLELPGNAKEWRNVTSQRRGKQQHPGSAGQPREIAANLPCEQRNLPARGFRPAVLLAGMAGIMTFGFWKLGQGIREHKYVLSLSWLSGGSNWEHRGAYRPAAEEIVREMRLTSWDSELAREKMWSRIYLIPLLTAEEDRDLARRHYADLAREKKLLGSETSAYNSDRYVDIFLGYN